MIRSRIQIEYFSSNGMVHNILTIFLAAGILSFEKLEPNRIVKVQSDSISYISATGAVAYGSILDRGEGVGTVCHCWSTSHMPTTDNSNYMTRVYYSTSTSPEIVGIKLLIGSGSGAFSTTLTGLSEGTTY